MLFIPRRGRRRALASLLPLLAAIPGLAVARPAAVAASPLSGITVAVPATRFVLGNGLTLIVHEDHSAPLVAVNIWYHVGSKDEPVGRSGFAHLFEHIMFNGSEHFDDDFFKATQAIGASDLNGTTSEDRTNYFETVPRGSLDSILWLESDRMGHLLGTLTQAKLDEQRKVVQNEKREGDNRPYAIADDLILRATMPRGHPYDHSVIGSMPDLAAATLDDARDWFRTFYGPSNAVIVLAGDITPAEARAKVERYFGDIPSGPPVAHVRSWPVPMTGIRRELAYDRVAQPRLYRVWNVADYAAADTDHLQLLASLLAGDTNARLTRRLVVDTGLATDVGAGVDNREIAGQFRITVTAKPDADLARIESIVDEELGKLLATGPTPAELDRVRTRTTASWVRGLEAIGGFSGKANLLAESQTYLGDPQGWRAGFERVQAARPADLAAAGRRWLGAGDYRLTILPFGERQASAAGVDRSHMPLPAELAPASFPAVERATLANGLGLVVVRRPGVPLVSLSLGIRTGTPADFASVRPGTGWIATGLLEEGTVARSRAAIVNELAALGAALRVNGGGESSVIGLSALKPALGRSLDLFADIVLHPAFREADVARVKAQGIAGIEGTRHDPSALARRFAPQLLFGPTHPYGRPPTEADIAALTPADLARFHARWFHPNNATLIVVGDTSLAEIRPQIERVFGAWMPAPVPALASVAAPILPEPVVWLVDQPGAPQSVITAAIPAPARLDGDDLPRQLMNNALGGSFTSRINMNLREAKGWAYGAGSGLSGFGRGPRLFKASAAVQADRTAEAMAEIARELDGVTGPRTLTPVELAAARQDMTLGLASDWSTNDGVAGALYDQLASGLPDNYYATYAARVGAITPGAAQRAAAEIIGTRPRAWLVVGDRAKIEAGVRALGLGKLVVVDADGKPVAAP